MRGAVDIRDVAKKAGVSVGTVSRVVNGHPSVSPAKRERVLAAIAELNYRPDAFARSLRKRSSDTIGVVIPDIRNPFFAELMHWIEIRARALGYSVLFVTSDEDPDAEREQLEAFVARKVDGIVWAPSYRAVRAPNYRATRASNAKSVPIVAVDRPIADIPSVAADNRGGARLAAEHLVSLGHRRIACIAGPRDSNIASLRLAGFLDVMTPHYRASGLPIDDYVAFSEFDYIDGRRAAAALLAAARPRPTAIVAGSDQQAIGALRAAADRGIGVPRDLSIVGFDGVPVTEMVTPRLTTVRQPVEQIADMAVALALGLEPANGAWPRLLACALVVRDSCAPVSAAPEQAAALGR